MDSRYGNFTLFHVDDLNSWYININNYIKTLITVIDSEIFLTAVKFSGDGLVLNY